MTMPLPSLVESKLAIISKTDLLPYVDFDMDRCIEYIRRVNPQMDVLTYSSKNDEGLDEIVKWISDNQKSDSSEPVPAESELMAMG